MREPAGILVPARAPDPYPPDPIPNAVRAPRPVRPCAAAGIVGWVRARRGAGARSPLAARVGARCRSKAQMRQVTPVPRYRCKVIERQQSARRPRAGATVRRRHRAPRDNTPGASQGLLEV